MYSVPSPPHSNWMPSSATTTLERSPASPSSPTRPTGRLRGLSYIRNYTQNHILSRDHSGGGGAGSGNHQRPSGLLRATSYPSPTSPRSSTIAAPSSPIAQRSQHNLSGERPSNTGISVRASELSPVVSQNAAEHTTLGPQISDLDSTTATASIIPSDTARSMARTRSATAGDATPTVDEDSQLHQEADGATGNGDNGRGMAHQLPSIRFSAHQDPRAQRPSLVFSPMARILPTGKETIKVGRYSERDSQPQQAVNVPSSAPVGFKSKVVSRRHCEFWYSGGRWFIKDVKSSSGTFLNHIRLSPPGTESRPFPVNDGDIVQLGIDFKGGEEMIFRCVKIRVELNKGWQTGPTSFNVQSHKRLRELNNTGKPVAGSSSQDCSICLGPIAPCQSLFVAPCSHTWHYKCIRVIINGPHWPHFICPNCRSVADLEAELDDPYANGEWEEVPNDANGMPPVQDPNPAVAPISAARTQHQLQNSSNDTAVESEPTREAESSVVEAEQESPSEDAAQSDDSSSRRSLHEIDEPVHDAGYSQMRNSPSPSLDSQPDQPSSSTVAPVDIIARKAVGVTSSRLQQPNERSIRTPSPHGLPSSLQDHVTETEGPMTPRNDVGPFIFDGSAGRVSSGVLANMAAVNLDEAANTPPLQTESTT